MRLIWYGNASVYIESEGTSLMFDPYLKDLPDGYEPGEMYSARRAMFEGCENILITHGHIDHLSSISELYGGSKAQIYLSRTPSKTLKKQGFDKKRLHIVAPGDTLQFGNINIRIYQGRHVKYDLRLLLSIVFSRRTWRMLPHFLHLLWTHLNYPEKKETLFYEIECEGKRIQIAGSAGLDKNTSYHAGADVLILPNQGRSDINSYNIEITKKLNPKRVLLDHWDDSFPPLSDRVDCSEYIERLRSECPQIKAEILLEGNEIWI